MKAGDAAIPMGGWHGLALPRREKSRVNSQDAVSEIIGVVMLLAMVISILGLVMVALKPYVDDFDDNKNWSSAMVTSERLADRISVVGDQPNGSGVVLTIPLVSTSINSLELGETWTIQADLAGNDRIQLGILNATAIEVQSQNETAASIEVSNDGIVSTHELQLNGEVQTVHMSTFLGFKVIIDVKDSDGVTIHRFVRMMLSGLRLDTQLNVGVHNLAMVNGGVLDRMPNEQWSIEKYPGLRLEETFSGQQRVTLQLVDVKSGGSMPSGNSAKLEITSLGPLSLFDGEARNLRFSMENNVHDIITPQYLNHWTGDHGIHVVSGTLDEYRGFGPWLRQSGADGLTLVPSDEPLLLEISLQQVEVVG